jgi:hypothetical protein
VILDGGSTRVFSPNDAPLLEDDLETLKVISFPILLCCDLFSQGISEQRHHFLPGGFLIFPGHD